MNAVGNNRQFDEWADAFAARWVRASPQLATVLQYFDGAEQEAVDCELASVGAGGEPIGEVASLEHALSARHGLAELARFPPSRLDAQRRISAAFLERRLRDVVATSEFSVNRFVFNQFHGLHVELITFMATDHPLRNAEDVEHYLTRLALVASVLDRGIAEATAAEARGVLPPRFILDRAIAQLEELTASPPREHMLVTELERNMTTLPGMSPDTREAAIARAVDLVARSVVPALERVLGLLRDERLRAGDEAGAWRLPRGAEYYARQLAVFSGSSQTPEEIHAIGVREVARIESEMHVLLDRLGEPAGTIRERVDRMNVALAPRGTGDLRASIVAELRALVDDAVERSNAVFSLRPTAPVTVEREPAYTERTAAAHYTTPAPDGSKPGIYWVPLADLTIPVPWLGIGMKSTAYHEAVPGHHFQLAIEQEAEHLPRYRKRMVFGFDSSFGEGWALYAEHLAAEFDWYGDDLPGRIGYLEMQLFRARRLVVDTGIHAFGWTRERAIDYGVPASEVERYIVWPGQACSYMLGQMRILALRERARNALGDRFLLQTFHDIVLANGSLPLDVLETVVRDWIDAAR